MTWSARNLNRNVKLSPALVLAAFVLGACALPRTAALQREVVNQEASENPTFQVVEVTRASASLINSWPQPSYEDGRHWFHSDRAPDSSVIQTGDTIEMVIWDSQDDSLISSGNKQTAIPPVSVTPAGTVFVPYVGDVRVRGLTEAGARDRIQSEVEMIVPVAQVQLTLIPGRNNSVDVSQGVNAPGRYPMDSRDMQILSVLSLAGGVDTGLRHPRVRLQRSGAIYETRLEEILDDPSKNVRVRGGDLIAVIEDSRTFNSVGASGRQELIYFEKEDMSAMDAVSAAGGVNGRSGTPRGVLILRDYHPRDLTPGPRGPDMQQVVFAFDLTSADGLFAARNFKVQQDDTLLMTQSPITGVQTIASLLGNLIGLGLSVSNLNE